MHNFLYFSFIFREVKIDFLDMVGGLPECL